MLESFRSPKAGPWVTAGGIVFLLAFLLTCGIIYSKAYEAVYHDYSASEHQAAIKDNFKKQCSSITAKEELLSCLDRQIETSWETQRAQEDLYAQKQMAKWAFWTLVVTGVVGILGLGFTVAGVYLVYLNLGEARAVTKEVIRQTESSAVSANAARDSVMQAQRQADMVEKNERAYVFGGGPKRKYSPNPDQTSDKKIIVSDEQYMLIQNHGRTIGFITSVEWGLCPAGDFQKDWKVSDFIDKTFLPNIKIEELKESEDNIIRPTEDHKIYGRVFFGDRAKGQVFFGRIRYRTLFDDKIHYSTFKLLLKKDADGSSPLPGCYSEDHD